MLEPTGTVTSPDNQGRRMIDAHVGCHGDDRIMMLMILNQNVNLKVTLTFYKFWTINIFQICTLSIRFPQILDLKGPSTK